MRILQRQQIGCKLTIHSVHQAAALLLADVWDLWSLLYSFEVCLLHVLLVVRRRGTVCRRLKTWTIRWRTCLWRRWTCHRCFCQHQAATRPQPVTSDASRRPGRLRTPSSSSGSPETAWASALWEVCCAICQSVSQNSSVWRHYVTTNQGPDSQKILR